MSQQVKFRAQQNRRTRIEDLAAIGDELPEDHLSLVSGGAPNNGGGVGGVIIVCQTYYPASSTHCYDTDWQRD